MGRSLTLADAIDNRQEARWVAAQLEKFAGLKLDTHVAVQAGLGAPGAPPQRGRAPSRPSSAFRRNSPVATAVGLAFFLAWMGFVGYHIFSRGHRQSNRLSKINASAKRSLRQVPYSPLTDMDVQRLQALPEQAQAEELLERAIQHDPRALDLFEQNVGTYRNLTRTAHMNELEERSRYSTDLRVRYANADLNLALDGLPKTNSSADQLITLAQADPAHRPYSVYHMGMLAGRGVDYDRFIPSWWTMPRMTPTHRYASGLSKACAISAAMKLSSSSSIPLRTTHRTRFAIARGATSPTAVTSCANSVCEWCPD